MSKYNNQVNLILAILQILVAAMWAFAAYKHSSWLIGFIALLFVALSTSTLEIYTLRKNE